MSEKPTNSLALSPICWLLVGFLATMQGCIVNPIPTPGSPSSAATSIGMSEGDHQGAPQSEERKGDNAETGGEHRSDSVDLAGDATAHSDSDVTPDAEAQDPA